MLIQHGIYSYQGFSGASVQEVISKYQAWHGAKRFHAVS